TGPSVPLTGCKGLSMVNTPSYFAETIIFPRESQENYKACNFRKGGTLFTGAKEKNINIISVTYTGLTHSFHLQKQFALSSHKNTP
uniref:Uncharacterized protein n=1 Tax=Prolemur simus TaxID=1328070 RepID=A0A8C8Z1P5_PROSS